MGKVYKSKKGYKGGSSCKMCKPHKNGWSPKHKNKHREHYKEFKKECDHSEE